MTKILHNKSHNFSLSLFHCLLFFSTLNSSEWSMSFWRRKHPTYPFQIVAVSAKKKVLQYHTLGYKFSEWDVYDRSRFEVKEAVRIFIIFCWFYWFKIKYLSISVDNFYESRRLRSLLSLFLLLGLLLHKGTVRIEACDQWGGMVGHFLRWTNLFNIPNQ